MKQAVRKPKLETLKPTVNGSTYLRPDKMEWKPTQFEKTWIKVLYEDKTKGGNDLPDQTGAGRTRAVSQASRARAGACTPGFMYDHDGTCRAGEFVLEEAKFVPREPLR